MSISIDVSEINQLATDLAKASREIRPAVSVVIRKGAFDIERDGKIFAPVDTGNLQNSISTTVSADGLRAEIGPTAGYGAYVEDGTSRQAPRPYMGPAVDRNTPRIMSALAQVAGSVL